MEKLEVRYPSLRKAKIEWEEESLISSFVLKSKPFDIKDLILLQPKLQRENATLLEIGKSRVSRWLEENKPPQVQDAATQMDLGKTASGRCQANYWKACTDYYCQCHLKDKQNQQWFPGHKPIETYWMLHKQHTMKLECNQQDWELCFVQNCTKHQHERQVMGLDNS